MSSKFEKLKEELKNRNSSRSQSRAEYNFIRLLEMARLYPQSHYIREYQVDYYFIDFAFPKIKKAVEIDGREYHRDKERDKKRDKYIESKGWRVQRVPASACFHAHIIGEVIRSIYCELFPGQPIGFGLSEIVNDNMEISRVRTVPEPLWLNPCKKCGECHMDTEWCQGYQAIKDYL